MSTIVRAPRTTRLSLLAAALVLSAFGVYVGWNMSDTEAIVGLPWTLLLAGALVLPPWGLCQLVAVGVRRGGSNARKLGALLDATAWLAGTVLSALVFSTAYDLGSPDLWTTVLFLAYSVPAYVLAALVRALAGPRQYGHVALLLAVAGLTIAGLTLVVRIVMVLLE